MKIFYVYYDYDYIINPIELINEYYFKETEYFNKYIEYYKSK